MTKPSSTEAEVSRRTLLVAAGAVSIVAGGSPVQAQSSGLAGPAATSPPSTNTAATGAQPGGSLPRASRTADVIIIGAGSAGATLAGRLAADSTRRVILIEAGGDDNHPALGRPLMSGVLSRWESLTWRFKTQPASPTNNRQISTVQARLVGGGSSINGMVWMRGRPSNFDDWVSMGLTDWSWDKVLANYRRIERFAGPPSADRGAFGQMPVQPHPATNPLFRVFLDAARQAGHPATGDINAAPYEGAGRFDCNFSEGRRWSAAHAFLDPARDNDNLSVVTRARVGRIIIENGRATGVLVRVGGATERFDAGEIVLAAGVLNSPKTLLLSGVGPAADLRAAGVPVALDRPGVGANLQDHLAASVTNVCTQPVTLYSDTRMDRAMVAFLRAWAFGTGPVAETPFGAGALLRSSPAAPDPDLQVYLIPALSTAKLRLPFARTPGDGHGFICSVQIVQPQSRGKVSLRGADPMLDPVIQPNYLAEPADREMLRNGLKICRDIVAQPAFDAYRGPELKPGAKLVTDAQLDAWIADNSGPGLHCVGTCKMGLDADPMAVVDQQLKVHGVEGLRVADASVMPKVTSGNTNAPSIMVGYRCASFILGEEAA